MKCPCGAKLVEPVHPSRIYCDECGHARAIARSKAWHKANYERKVELSAEWYAVNRKNNSEWREINKRRARAWRKKHRLWVRLYDQQHRPGHASAQ